MVISEPVRAVPVAPASSAAALPAAASLLPTVPSHPAAAHQEAFLLPLPAVAALTAVVPSVAAHAAVVHTAVVPLVEVVVHTVAVAHVVASADTDKKD